MPNEDSKCAICDDGECENSNAIVFCDGCNLAVHQGKGRAPTRRGRDESRALISPVAARSRHQIAMEFLISQRGNGSVASVPSLPINRSCVLFFTCFNPLANQSRCSDLPPVRPPGHPPQTCVLCPNSYGAFKQTTTGQWAHLLCAIWVPETGVVNTVYMEPVDGLEVIPKSRWKLVRRRILPSIPTRCQY